MANVVVELDQDGIIELLQSKDMLAVCQGYANEVQKKCGSGYTTGQMKSSDRWKTTVHASSFEARQDNSQNNTLLKAIGGSQ